MSIFSSLFKSSNDRSVKKYQQTVKAVNDLEAAIEKLSDKECRQKIADYKKLLASDGNNGGGKIDASLEKKLNDILPEVFALTREASKRTLQLRHFDVQLMGGLVLHQGAICEMKTGEGKTLVATLAAVLNSLLGRGVHVVTVNDYLARRDAEWMGQIYEFLGLSVGVIANNMTDEERKIAYQADITYGTNNEFGFDYLRDNLKLRPDQIVQRGHCFAIVDEVDSILVDEARTPLIISGPTNEKSELYRVIDNVVKNLGKDDFEVNEKERTIQLTDQGHHHLEEILKTKTNVMPKGGLFDFENLQLLHHADQALKAHYLFRRDKDYIVKNGKIVIIDEFTGRMMSGRRYSEGLHQALEAKEGVAIEPENQTIASTTFQNYFRLYHKLSGMTGTAMTEAAEFDDIYKLAVIAIPTNEKMIRDDRDDEIYRTSAERDDAVVMEIIAAQKKGQPILVGTTSIEKSELFAEKLRKHQINCQVLNARHHEAEAMIIADAGRTGAVTIATNMAGRGTDIQLGGNLEMHIKRVMEQTNDETLLKKEIERVKKDIADNKEQVLKAGGLYIIGTERHESRRIDNQLRGRAGRQGDVGASKFFISLDDDLMRIFGSEKLAGMLQKLGLEKGEAIVHPWISKALENAQKKVEERNFEIRKHLLKFDDVMNDQRKVVFQLRHQIMFQKNTIALIEGFIPEIIQRAWQKFIPEKSLPEEWKLTELAEFYERIFGVKLPIEKMQQSGELKEEAVTKFITEKTQQKWCGLEKKLGKEDWQNVASNLFLQVIDHLWKGHLRHLDYVRGGIGLRAYGQRDPLNEYKQEAFMLFEQFLSTIQDHIVGVLCHVELDEKNNLHDKQNQSPSANPSPNNVAGEKNNPPPSRNSPCPCGSGKKYKHCHGAIKKAL